MFVFVLAIKQRRFRNFILFLLGLFPFLVFWGYYNWLRTGLFYLLPSLAGAMSGRWPDLAPTHNIIKGLSYLLFSKGGSIFIYSPILLLAIFGWKGFFRERRKECILTLSIVILFLLANSKVGKWYGLWGWGPRYTLDITPLMMLPLGYWLSAEGMRNRIKKYLFIIIAGYSLLIQLAATLTNWHARLGYLIERKGQKAIFFTAKYSQWWDAIKTLFINLWNLIFGSFLYLENPGGYQQTISKASLYTSKTLFTWWNRFIFMGFSPVLVLVYVVLSLVVAYYLFRYLEKTA